MKKQNNILKRRMIAVVVAIMAAAALSFGQQQTGAAEAQSNEQEYCSNEFSIWAAGGLSTLNYKPGFGDRSNMAGGAFGIGYSHYWNRNFGFLLGAELALYQSKFNANGLQDNYNTVDLDIYNEPEKINFRYRLDDYEELQQMWNVNIPLMLQFRSNRFYAGLGFKLGVPLKASYETSDYGITGMGYYYDEKSGSKQVLNDVTELGFGEFSNKSVKSKIDLGLSYTGALEAGLKWNVGGNTELYTGLYFDYTFNDVLNEKRDKRLVEYSSFDENKFDVTNSVLVSQHAPIGNLNADALSKTPSKSMVDHVAPVAFGVKIRLGIGACPKDKEAKKEKSSRKKIKEQPIWKDSVAPPPSQTMKAKRGMVVVKPNDNDKDNSFILMPEDNNLAEEFRRATSEYGASLRGVVNIELEGYELDQSELSSLMKIMLDEKIAQIIDVYGTDVSIVCEGHTCDVGIDSHNMKLGQKRAEAVRKILISKGFDPNKITAISKGKYLPIEPNINEANRKKNRRVMLIIKD